MTAITQNLPWFVRDLGVGVIGEKCYTSLIHNLDLSDVECIKYAISKGLGVGIVAGGSIMKVPQLVLVLRSQSATGLSLPSYILETLSYGITLAYSFRSGFPFSTYGENFFLTIQNVLITMLIIAYGKSSSKGAGTAVVGLGLVGTGVALWKVSGETLAWLQIATLPLSLSSKIPQIISNYSNHSTGNLSAFAIIAQILGCVARVFTTIQEVKGEGREVVLAGFVLALALNVVLGLQLAIYWGQGAERETGALVEAQEKKIRELDEQTRPQTPVAEKVSAYETTPAQATRRVGSPAPSPSGNRKWARRVD